MREIVALGRLFFSFFDLMRLATGRPVGPIVVNGSNDASSLPSRPFYGFVNKKNIFPYFLPKNVKNCITTYGIVEDMYKLFAPNRRFSGSRNRMVSFKFTPD